jgi:3-oxoacyl-[acyl-carrier protein] reductase
MDLNLAGKVVFVTGSSRGIGRAIASAFLQEGARVVVSGRDKAALDVTCEAFAKFEDQIFPFCGDLLKKETIESALDQIHTRWGKIDSLVANIGSGTARSGWDLNEDDWNDAFEINFRGAVRITQAILPEMKTARSGNIVYVGSIVGIESINAPLAYSAAKATLHNYAVNLAKQVGSDGIRVNCLAPGNVLFEGGSWEKKLQERREFFEAYIRAEVPLQRFGTPDDIANAALFLASDRAAFITGSVLVADGGQTRSY